MSTPYRRSRRPRAPRLAASLLLGVLLAIAGHGIETVPLDSIPISEDTGEKPQSKTWQHGGTWWAVLASDDPSGTWVWRLEADGSFSAVLKLSSSRDAKADVVPVDDLAHVLLCDSSGSSCSGSPELVSIEYVPIAHSYELWPLRPTATPVSLPSNETSTLEIDSTGRLWIATTRGSDVDVLYSDSPYTSFDGPITLNPSDPIGGDDISLVTLLADDEIGVMWSNQRDERFGFRTHADGDPPTVWSDDEVPASQSAENRGNGMADDHLNVALASDGTLYAAVKTSYDSSSYPKIALLVRRPDGSWDDLYEVDNSGTRPIVLLNEVDETVQVLYSSSESGGDILINESSTSNISFGSPDTLLNGDLNNVSSTKQNWVADVMVIASGGGSADAVLMTGSGPPPPPPPPVLVACNDGVDNDGDGHVDFPDDPGCLYASWPAEDTPPGVLLAEDFAAGSGLFVYRDDAFLGTSEPNFAEGNYELLGGIAGGALAVTVGGDAVHTSGGFAATFHVLDGSIPVEVEIGYRLEANGGYEPDEFVEALLSIDGDLYGVSPDSSLWSLTGGSSTDMDSGWQAHAFELDLAAGAHEIVVGVYNNKSTASKEQGVVWVDRVSVTAPEPACSDDFDGDGYRCDVDCNDDDSSVHPDQLDGCNGVDDDCDEVVDEDFSATVCNTGQWGVCAAGTTVCEAGATQCTRDTPPSAGSCSNGLDDDCDGYSDYPADPGCADTSDLSERGEPLSALGWYTCDDGVDNDADGLADFPDDPGCAGALGNTEAPPCDDGVDNDGDGAIDYPGDLECANGSDTSEALSGDQGCGNGFALGALMPLAIVLNQKRRRR